MCSFESKFINSQFATLDRMEKYVVDSLLVIPKDLLYTKLNGGESMLDKTMTFSLGNERQAEIRRILTAVYDALREKGYNPINQIVGYILSEDPTYITTHNNARSLIRRIDRDELLQVLVKSYLDA